MLLKISLRANWGFWGWKIVSFGRFVTMRLGNLLSGYVSSRVARAKIFRWNRMAWARITSSVLNSPCPSVFRSYLLFFFLVSWTWPKFLSLTFWLTFGWTLWWIRLRSFFERSWVRIIRIFSPGLASAWRGLWLRCWAFFMSRLDWFFLPSLLNWCQKDFLGTFQFFLNHLGQNCLDIFIRIWITMIIFALGIVATLSVVASSVASALSIRGLCTRVLRVAWTTLTTQSAPLSHHFWISVFSYFFTNELSVIWIWELTRL